jgi:hypothetical protein
MRKSRRRFSACALLSVCIAFAFSPALWSQSREIPENLSDAEFWRLITELSETGGRFQPQLMTNEDSLQFVIPNLKSTVRTGGVYIGVGTEQNFTYAASVRARMAFVVDIRRDNLLEHLMYKALFELSSDRADFVSRLFARKRPAVLGADSSVAAIFDAYRGAERDSVYQDETVSAVLDLLTVRRRFPLSDADRTVITGFMKTFGAAGPEGLKGSGDKNLSYAQSMTGTDLAGQARGYLASEDDFKFVKDLQRRNMILPLVGDFAGDTAIAGIGRYLRDHNATVDVFYVSNVERYLWDQGKSKQFYATVAALPLDASSTFIRSVIVDITRRLGIAIPDQNANWRSFLSPMKGFLTAYDEGRIQSYADLF